MFFQSSRWGGSTKAKSCGRYGAYETVVVARPNLAADCVCVAYSQLLYICKLLAGGWKLPGKLPLREIAVTVGCEPSITKDEIDLQYE